MPAGETSDGFGVAISHMPNATLSSMSYCAILAYVPPPSRGTFQASSMGVRPERRSILRSGSHNEDLRSGKAGKQRSLCSLPTKHLHGCMHAVRLPSRLRKPANLIPPSLAWRFDHSRNGREVSPGRTRISMSGVGNVIPHWARIALWLESPVATNTAHRLRKTSVRAR